MTRRTFVHHDGALGDVLLSLPVLRTIRSGSAFLHFAGRTDAGNLFRHCLLVDEASSSGAARYASLYNGRADAGLAAFLRSFDRAVLFTVDPSSQAGAALSSLIPATTVILTIPPPSNPVHVSDFRSAQLPAAPRVEGTLLPVPRQYLDLAAALLNRLGHDGSAPLVALHPGSGGKMKSWPLERFFELTDRLKASLDAFVIIVTGPVEDDAMKDRVEAFSRQRRGVAHLSEADLITVAALTAVCDLFIGNDSGVGHLAAAAGCPVLALFGPTDPLLWRPRGSRVEVMAAPALAEIGVDGVYSRAASMLNARL